MYRTCFVRRVLIAMVTVSFIAAPAWADLTPVVQVIGRVSVSVDAEGNNNSLGGTIRIVKPGGATVRSAFLMAASNFNRVVADGDVALAGTPVSWDRTVFNNAGTSFPTFFNNVFADVTSIVKPILDAAPSGVSELHVTEVNTATIDGTILAVVFDDPNQTVDSAVIVLFGGQNTLGDRFTVNFAEPLDPTGPNSVLDMGLGISFGFQGTFGTNMVTLIDVNGSRLTSSAGGEDDGGSFNGGLITVGGIGDSNNNPPPFAASSDFRTDDELYDLLPFVGSGDTSILVETLNPTDDDNIFFAYFVTSVPAAILPDVPPPGSRAIVGDIDPNRPTIVLTHGLQSKSDPIEDLWTGTRSNQASTLIRNFLGSNNANIVQYIWEEGFQPFGVIPGLPTGQAYKEAQRNVVDAGIRLASELFRALGPTYEMPIHFIGHSLGTAVNAYAAGAFLNEAPRVTRAQFTALDRPQHIDKIPGLNGQDELLFGYNPDFFSSVLPISRPDLDLRIDNYYSLEGAGVGDVANGPVYNHPELINPNDLDDRIFSDEAFDNNHTGVQQWYRWTINPIDPRDGATVCDGDEFAEGRKPFGFDDSLNPCQRGWHWSLNNNPETFPPPNGVLLAMSSASPLRLTESREFGCRIETDGPITRIICNEASSPFLLAQVEIPDEADFLSFEYNFSSNGDGDYAAIIFDDVPVWVLAGSSAIPGRFLNSGAIAINGLTGSRTLIVALYGVGQPNFEFVVQNFRVFTVNMALAVAIDIKPGSDPNAVNPRSRGVIPVAVLTTDTFDASTIVPLSVEFGSSGAHEAHNLGHIEDVDGDGDLDLVLHFRTQETGIQCGDTEATLTGQTFDGQPIQGSDSIVTVSCR